MYGSEQVAEVLIESTSIRRVTLMKEDFIRLDFTLDRAICFRRGCSIDDEIFGRFIMRKEQMPQYQENTGGYKYQLQFDAEYMHMEDSKYMLTVQKESPTEKGAYLPIRESADFSLTADLYGQLNSWVIAADAIGSGIVFNPATDVLLPSDQQKDVHSIELMQFSRKGMLSALGDICNKWGVEYWFVREDSGYRMKIGKCETGAGRVDLELGVNVAQMRINDGTKDYANRLYVFGGTNNIAYDYRKEIQNSIAGYCKFTRSNREFYVFKLANNRADYIEALFRSGDVEQHSGVISGNLAGNGKTIISDANIIRFSLGINGRFGVVTQQDVVDGGNKSATATFTVKVFTKTALGAEVEIGRKTLSVSGIAKWSAEYQFEGVQYGHYYFDVSELDFGSFSQEYQPSSRFTGEIKARTIEATYAIAGIESGSAIAYLYTNVRYSYSVPSAKIAIEVNDDNGTERVHKTIYAWFYDEARNIISYIPDADFQENILVFSDTKTIDWGSTTSVDSFTKLYTLDGLLNVLYTGYTGTASKGTVSGAKTINFSTTNPDAPSRIFSSPYDDPSSLLRLGESRLRLPADTDGYLETEEGANPDTRIERCVIFNDIYPRLELYVSNLLTTDETETQEYEGEDRATEWMFKQYFAELSFIGGAQLTRNNFSKKYLLDGSTLKIKFVSPRDFGKADADYVGKCLLSGMEFDLEWMPSGVYYTGDNGHQVLWGGSGCFKILRNTTYGSKLPGEELKPQTTDLCTLLGVSARVFGRTNAYTDAEFSLKEKGLAYLAALKEGNFTFDCTMLAEFMRHMAINEQEGLASQNELAFTLPSPTSTNTDALYLGRKVRILNDALPSKIMVPKSIRQLTTDDFSEFIFGLLISNNKIAVPARERVEIEILGYSDYIFLWNSNEGSESVVAGAGSLIYENKTYSDEEFYLGLGRLQKYDASVLEEYLVDGWGTHWGAPEPVKVNPGRTITIQSSATTAMMYYTEEDDEIIIGGTEDNTQWTNETDSPIVMWVGTKDTPADIWLYMNAEGQDVRIVDSRYIGTKDSRVIGYEMKLDCPEDGARYTIGETEAYSRLDKLEKEISKS